MTHRSQRTGVGLVAAGTVAACLALGGVALAAGTVIGTYTGNDQEGKLSHAVFLPHDDHQGEKVYLLVFSQKDPKGIKKPDFDAMFGKLGHALVVRVSASGAILGAEICHQALKRSGFSSLGTLTLEGFKVDGNRLAGRLTSGEERTFGDDVWEADFSFEAVPHAAK